MQKNEEKVCKKLRYAKKKGGMQNKVRYAKEK
jgi:hypothetical protein